MMSFGVGVNVQQLVKSWAVIKLPNLNYLHLVHNYLMKAKDSAPAWESTVDAVSYCVSVFVCDAFADDECASGSSKERF